MKKKIIITGALGYIGTELCKLYSGESWFHEIIAIDNRFISERVNQLKKWGIKFYNCDILDKTNIKEIIKDSNIVHHLAGVTDVAYVKKDSDPEKDNKIIETSIDGTANIVANMPKGSKIIFPSSHVIFEGLEETKRDISENAQNALSGV